MFIPSIWRMVARPWIHLGFLAALCFFTALTLAPLLALGQDADWRAAASLSSGVFGRLADVNCECATAPGPGVAGRTASLSQASARKDGARPAVTAVAATARPYLPERGSKAIPCFSGLESCASLRLENLRRRAAAMDRLLQAETEAYNLKVEAFHAPWTSAERQVELFLELADRAFALDRKEAELTRILTEIRSLEPETEDPPVREITALSPMSGP